MLQRKTKLTDNMQVESASANKAENKKKKSRIPLSVLVIYAILVTLALSSATLAKYASSGEGRGSLQVAAFDVTASSTVETYDSAVPMEIGPDKTGSFEIEINNTGSDVSVLCDIELVSVASLPIVFTVEDQDGVSQVVTDNRFLNDMKIDYNETAIYTVTVSWNPDYLDYRYSYELDYIDIFVDVVQAD